jgi:putative restriction endonuclease
MLAVAPTDQEWFEQLRDMPGFDEVNFWTPTPWRVRGLKPDDRFYFMLKHPIRKIGGFGSFVRYEDSPASIAWARYGEANGVRSLHELVGRTRHYAGRHSTYFGVRETDPMVGNIILSDGEFFDEKDYFTAREAGISFAPTVVKQKYFPDLTVLSSGRGELYGDGAFSLVGKAPSDYVKGRRKARPGQAHFRSEVLRAYGRRCAVTGEGVPELLEAGHIEPYIDGRSDHLQNGICLRADLHRLFDAGLIAIGDSGQLLVSFDAGQDELCGPCRLDRSPTGRQRRANIACGTRAPPGDSVPPVVACVTCQSENRDNRQSIALPAAGWRWRSKKTSPYTH